MANLIPKALGEIGSMAKNNANHIFMGGMFLHGVNSDMAEGKSFLGAVASEAVDWTMFDVMYGSMGLWGIPASIAVEGLKALPGAAVSAFDSLQQQDRQMQRMNRQQMPFRNNTFVDGPQLYTMRQAGLALAAKSQYSLQQTMMGNEAKYMHR